MSYLSIESVLNERGLSNEDATEAQRKAALWEAFQRDLPLGIAWVRALVATFIQNSKQRTVINEDPKSETGGQVIRLLGTDVAREVCRESCMREFNLPSLAFGLFNCCGGVVAESEDKLNMTAEEQIRQQTKGSGKKAPQHC